MKWLTQLDLDWFSEPIAVLVLKAMLKDPQVNLETLKVSLVGKKAYGSKLTDLDVSDWLTLGALDSNYIGPDLELLKSLRQKEKLLELAEAIPGGIESAGVVKTVSAIQKRLVDIEKSVFQETGSIDSAMQEYTEAKKDKKIWRFRYLPVLQEKTGGMRSGQVFVVGAGSGVGKSYFVSDCALKWALDNQKVLFFSTELSKEVMLQRLGQMVCAYSGLDSVEDGVKLVAEMKHLFLYGSITEPDEIVMEIRRQHMISQVSVVVIDHLQDMTGDPKLSQYELITRSCTSFKDLALKLRIGMVLVSQLNRAGSNQKERGFSYAGSGKIEQVSHVAMKLRRHDDYQAVLWVEIDKNRGNVDNPKGGTGVFPIVQSRHGTFGELSPADLKKIYSS